LQLKPGNSMELKILQEKQNPLFARKEIQAEIQVEVSPTKAETEKMLSEKFSTQLECIDLRNIKGEFGSNNFKIIAHIYSSKEDKEKIIPKPKNKKEKK